MSGEHIGEAADFAAAHGVGLAGDRKRPRAPFADAPGQEMGVDDGVDLVGPGRGLIDALRIDGDGFFRRDDEIVEALNVFTRQAGFRCNFFDRPDFRRRQRIPDASGMIGDKISLALARALQFAQQAAEESDIRARRERQMQIGDFTRRGAARVDIDDLRQAAALFARRRNPLIENRMAPGEIGADQHDEIGFLQILVDAWNRIGAEGALVAGDGR